MVKNFTDRAEALRQFRNLGDESAILRSKGGAYWLFSPATKAIGHPTAEREKGNG